MLSHCSQSSGFKCRIDVRLEQLLPARWKPELEFMHYLATNNSITAGRTNRPKRRPLVGYAKIEPVKDSIFQPPTPPQLVPANGDMPLLHCMSAPTASHHLHRMIGCSNLDLRSLTAKTAAV